MPRGRPASFHFIPFVLRLTPLLRDSETDWGLQASEDRRIYNCLYDSTDCEFVRAGESGVHTKAPHGQVYWQGEPAYAAFPRQYTLYGNVAVRSNILFNGNGTINVVRYLWQRGIYQHHRGDLKKVDRCKTASMGRSKAGFGHLKGK